MRRGASGLVSLLAVVIVLWLIWSRLRIVVFVAIPWWGLLIAAILLFLVIDYLLHRLLRRN